MAQVTLRDLATNEDIIVPPEGYIFGRVGGDADIQLEDNSISRRQARVSLKGGLWLLETLAVPQGQRAARPVQLQEGATFLVGQSEFEVVQVEEDEVEEAPRPPPAKAKSAAPAPKKAPPPPSNAKTMASPGGAPAPAKKSAPVQSAAKDSDPDDSAPPASIGAMFVAVPKGIAYYLLNIPKILVNPVGAVRTSIDEQPAEPMGRTEIIGYALPALAIMMLLPAWATAIALLIAPPHSFQFMLFVPIVPAISAIIGAVVYGFIWHPVTTWIIEKLQGQSDARSRTNYLLNMLTLMALIAVPQTLGILLSVVPYLGLLIAPILNVVVALAFTYVNYKWFEHFGVVKWFKTVLLVIGALSVLGGVWGLITGIRVAVSGIGSGPTVVATTDGDTEGEDLGVETMPTDPAEAAEWSKKKQAQIMARAKEAQEKAQKAAQDAQNAAADDAPPAKDPVAEAPTRPSTQLVTGKETKPTPAADPEPVKETPPPQVKEEPVVAAPTPTVNGAYGAFARKRDTIEKTFEADPTVLKKSTELQRLYGEYLDEVAEIDKKWGKEFGKNRERMKLNQRLRDAELFEKSNNTIDSLAKKMNIR